MEEGKYLIQNGVDRYVLDVEWNGKFTVKELPGKLDRTAYLFQ